MDKPNPVAIYSLIAVLAILLLSLTSNFLESPIGYKLKMASDHGLISFAAAHKAIEKLTSNPDPVRKNNLYLILPEKQVFLNAPSYTAIDINKVSKNISQKITSTFDFVIEEAKKTVDSVAGFITPTVQSTIQETKSSTPKIPESKTPETVEKIINEIPTFTSLQTQPNRAIVNILCKIQQGKTIKNISSSGVLISNNGIILTNAHVAIHPFLQKYADPTISCTARNGSPASGSTPVEFIYMSPSWTYRHTGEINGSLSQDSGENDFALLKINPKGLNNLEKIPVRTMSTILNFGSANTSNINSISRSKEIWALSYPINLSLSSPNLLKESLTIQDYFGFRASGMSTGFDLIETSRSGTAKSGSSGGALIDNQNYLIGIIANIVSLSPTQSNQSAQTVSNIHIRALNTEYIDKELQTETGISLSEAMHLGNTKSITEIFDSKYLPTVKNNLVR